MKKFILTVMCMATMALGSVTNTNTRISHSADGGTTAYSFDFPIIDTSDLVVISRLDSTGAETVLTEITDYAVTSTNNDYSSGGTVTTTDTLASGITVLILRDTPDTQNTTLSDSGVLRLASLEDAYDKITLLVQQLQEQADRSAYAPRTDSENITYELPSSIDRASKNMGWDSSGNVIATSLASTGSVSFGAFGTDMAATADAAAATALLGIDDAILTSVIDVRTFGTTGDGIADDGPAVDAAIASLVAGDTLYFPRGNYLLTTHAVQTLILSVTFVGDGGENTTITGPDLSTNLVEMGASGNLVMKNIGFSTFDTVVDGTAANTDYVIIDNCYADSCNNIYADAGGAATGDVGVFKVTDCQLTNMSGKAINLNAAVSEAVLISNNYIDTCTGAVAIDLGTAATDTANNSYIITNNYIKDVSGGSVTHAISCYGLSATISNNYINSVANVSNANCEGIYTECAYSVVSGNTMVDAAENDAAINIAGNNQGDGSQAGYGNTVTNNNIYFSVPFSFHGIQVGTGECIVSGNYIENADSGILCNGDRNVVINGNVINNAKEGIKVKTLTNHQITSATVSNNIVYGTSSGATATGIGMMFDSTNANINYLNITGNTIRSVANSGNTASGMTFTPGATFGISYVTIIGNIFSDMDQGINVTAGTFGRVVTSDNVFEGSYAVQVIDPQVWGGTDSRIDNNLGFVTESSGSSTESNAGTIAHGCDATPTYINVVPGVTAATDVYCEVDATNVKVYFTGGGSKLFYWEAKVR